MGEYAELICRYFQAGFPKVVSINKDNLLEILTTVVIGTKDLRYGPIPKIENQYTIRQTLAKAIEMGEPIPMLVPWGGKKMDSSLSIDVAEVSGLRQLIYLDETVKRFYKPGLLIHIRIEDTGALWLYRNHDVEDAVERYSSDFSNLVKVLRGDSLIFPIRESLLMDKDTYFAASKMYSDLLDGFINTQLELKGLDVETIPEYKELKAKGWKGEIPEEQRDHYISMYKKLYPGLSTAEYITLLADYLGGAKARYDLKGRGEPDSPVGSFIQGTFVPPIPGAPKTMFNNTLYYRTVPETWGRTHLAPWRGKGYLSIINNDVIPKITYQANPALLDLRESYVEMNDEKDENLMIKVRADYNVTDSLYLYPAGIM